MDAVLGSDSTDSADRHPEALREPGGTSLRGGIPARGPKREEHKANVTAVKVSDDRKSAELIVDGRRANYVYHIRIDATSEKGEKMWSPESWVTFHKAPK